MSDERQTEIECVNKFRAKATKLQAADPRLPRSIAMARAAEALPKTMNRYLYVRSLLKARGVAALPFE